MRLYIIFYIIFSVVIFTGCGENDIDISTSFNPDNIDLSEKENIDIDSVSSHYVFDFEYQPSVVELSDEQIEYLIVDDPFDDNSESLSFRADTPENLLPAVGQIVVINSDRSDKFPFGFMGMIYDSSRTDFKTSEVELTDVYKNLNVDIRVNKEQLASTDSYAFIYDDSELEEVALDEFYDGFPNMRNQYDISEKLSGNEAALHPALKNQPFNAKPSGSNTVLELKKGELSLMGSQIFKLPKNYNWISLTASGGITLKLLTQGVQVKIEDSNLTELRQDIGVRIGGGRRIKT